MRLPPSDRAVQVMYCQDAVSGCRLGLPAVQCRAWQGCAFLRRGSWQLSRPAAGECDILPSATGFRRY